MEIWMFDERMAQYEKDFSEAPLEELEKELFDIIELDVNNEYSQMTLAHLYIHYNKYDSAQVILNKLAVSSQIEISLEAIFYLGEIALDKTNQHEKFFHIGNLNLYPHKQREAHALFERYLSIFPNNTMVMAFYTSTANALTPRVQHAINEIERNHQDNATILKLLFETYDNLMPNTKDQRRVLDYMYSNVYRMTIFYSMIQCAMKEENIETALSLARMIPQKAELSASEKAVVEDWIQEIKIEYNKNAKVRARRDIARQEQPKSHIGLGFFIATILIWLIQYLLKK